jgi:Arc/MetJ family transcription regulator
MRTTVDLDDDVAAAVSELRRQRSLGVSQAVNQLARQGLRARPAPARFHQRTAKLGLRLDVTNVAEALDLLESERTD